MQSCRQLTVPHTGCGVTSGLIDTPSTACLLESPVYVSYSGAVEQGGQGGNCPPNITFGGALPPQLCSEAMCMYIYMRMCKHCAGPRRLANLRLHTADLSNENNDYQYYFG